jgi:hypothetical protein
MGPCIKYKGPRQLSLYQYKWDRWYSTLGVGSIIGFVYYWLTNKPTSTVERSVSWILSGEFSYGWAQPTHLDIIWWVTGSYAGITHLDPIRWVPALEFRGSCQCPMLAHFRPLGFRHGPYTAILTWILSSEFLVLMLPHSPGYYPVSSWFLCCHTRLDIMNLPCTRHWLVLGFTFNRFPGLFLSVIAYFFNRNNPLVCKPLLLLLSQQSWKSPNTVWLSLLAFPQQVEPGEVFVGDH